MRPHVLGGVDSKMAILEKLMVGYPHPGIQRHAKRPLLNHETSPMCAAGVFRSLLPHARLVAPKECAGAATEGLGATHVLILCQPWR